MQEEVMQQRARLKKALSNASASLDKTTEGILLLLKEGNRGTYSGWLKDTILKLTEAAAPRVVLMPESDDSL